MKLIIDSKEINWLEKNYGVMIKEIEGKNWKIIFEVIEE